MARLLTYKAGSNERIEIGYLRAASPEAVAQWMRHDWKEPQGSNFGWRVDTDGRHLLEFILSKRNEPLIDHALARYGYTKAAIQIAYDRGDVSTRYAAVANPRGNIALRQTAEILRTGKPSMVEALVQSAFLPGEFFEKLFGRKEPFADIDDHRLIAILFRIKGSPRLSRAYDDTFLDGYAEHTYNKSFQAAWDLTKTVPTDQRWATALWELLGQCERPRGGIENLDQAIERWRIDQPFKGEPEWWKRSPSFHVRTLLAGFLKPDQALLDADDAALRMSFYKNFAPWQFKDWPTFLEKDGSEFISAALQNTALWRDSGERERLEKTCWDCPDPHSNMDAPNDFRGYERQHRERNPQWFPSEAVDDPVQRAIQEIKERLDAVVELLGDAIRKKRDLLSESSASTRRSRALFAVVGVRTT